MSEAWSQWQGQVIDGKFPLKQHLGGSGQSAVFLAQLFSRNGEAKTVAMRLIADSPNAELQLSRWRMAQDVSHPNLLRILDTGRCRLGVIDLIYAVMEYGEENLAQIVTERPLTAEEAHALLGPALDALTYLHSRGLVHAHLKPASIMAIGDELKLSSDGICPADVPVSFELNGVGVQSSVQPGDDAAKSGQANAVNVYNAPEIAGGIWSAAADVWSLGATLAEVLTQHPPSTDSLNHEADPLLPENLPVQFVEIVRGCLRRDLQLRWTIPAIQKRLHETRVAQAPQPVEARIKDTRDTASIRALDGESGVLEPAITVTFAEALRTKDLASQTTVQEKPLAAASDLDTRVAQPSGSPDRAGVTRAEVEAPGFPDRAGVTRDGVEALSAVTLIRASTGQGDSVFTRSSVTSRSTSSTAGGGSATPASRSTPVLTAIQTFISQATQIMRGLTSQARIAAQRIASQAAPAAHRIASQTKIAAQRVASQAKRADLIVASQIEALVRRSPGKTIQRVGLVVVILFTTAVALYISPGLLRHKPASQSARETSKPAPKVIIAHPERKPSPKKRASASTAKPNPGTPQSGQSVSPSQNEQPPAAAAVQANSQPSQPQSQTVALQRDAQAGVRRIDDGGSQDNDQAPSAASAGARSGNTGDGNAAPVTVDGVQRVLPEISPSALHTIRGTVRVSVRVKLDPSGKVARAELASAGPSKYFARKSLEAAQNWKFAPGQNAGNPLLLHFEFRNSGARAFATRVGG
jgi:TonB family protein